MPSRSEKLRRQRQDVEKFTSALGALLQVMEQVGHPWGGSPVWAPKTGREEEAFRLALAVDEAAGRASHALHDAGSFIEWKPRGTWATQVVMPTATWRTILDDDPMFDVAAILACCAQARGLIEMRLAEAEETERSLEGRIGHAVGFFERVRGGKRGSERREGFVSGVSVALVAAVLAGGVLHVLGWV